MTEEQAFDKFISNFTDLTGELKIDKSQWDDFFYALSFALNNDDHFEILLKKNWRME
jgi:hypothetical protein